VQHLRPFKILGNM